MSHSRLNRALAAPLGFALLAALGACGGGGGGGSSGTPADPPVVPPPEATASGAAAFQGIGSLSPLADGFEVAWDPIPDEADPDSASADYAYAVFATFDGSAPDLAGAPLEVTAAGASGTSITGLAQGTRVRVAVRAVPQLAGPVEADENDVVIDGEVAPFLYVDAAAAPGGDGRSAGQPLTRIADAIVTAIGDGTGANILVAEGVYVEELAVLGGIHLYGGYAAGFDGERDPAAFVTALRPAAFGAVALRVLANSLSTIVDGFVLDGGASVPIGIDIRDAGVFVSNCRIFAFSAEGLDAHCRQATTPLMLHRVELTGNGAEGLQATGSFRASFSRSSFALNAHEGVEFDDLSVQPADVTVLALWRCALSDNGEDGLDADLDELDPLSGTSSEDGTIEVAIEECSIERNGAEGLLADVDYDAADEVYARVLLRANRVRANALNGIDLDGDQSALFVLFDNVTAANRARGVLFGSDSPDLGRATCLLANHWDLGSGIEGMRFLGPGDVVSSHAAICGTPLSFAANGSTRFVNGAIWDAGAPSGATTEWSFRADGGGGDGCFAGPVELSNFPDPTFHLAAPGGTDRIPVPAGVPLGAGDVLEIDDDGVARTVTGREGALALFAPSRSTAPPVGAWIGLFAAADVAEDPALIGGSTWVDRGDATERDDDGTITDVGVLGGRLLAFRPGGAPGLFPFVPERFEPALGPASVAPAEIRICFTRPIDPASVDDVTFAVALDGVPVAGTREASGDDLVFTPTAPFGSGELEITLGPDLEATAAFGSEKLALPLRYVVILP